MCKSNNSSLIGLQSATFELKGNGTNTIDLTPVHDLLKDKKCVGVSLPTNTTTSNGSSVYSTNNVFLTLVDSSQSNLNLKLPSDTIRKYSENVGRFYPINPNVSFQYSKIETGADVATTNYILLTVHYD